MPSAAIGPFDVEGPNEQIDLVRRALDRLDPGVKINHFVRAPFQVIFGPVPNTPGFETPAFGFFRGATRKLLIRHGMPNARNLRKVEAEYTFLHEALGHGGERDGVLNAAKRAEVLAAMGVPLTGVEVGTAWRRGSTPAGTKVRYWHRPYEAYCDLLVAAVSDVPPLFERKYKWDIEPDRLKEIVLRNTPMDADHDPGDEPDALGGGPEDEDCDELADKVDALRSERNDLRDLLKTMATKIDQALA